MSLDDVMQSQLKELKKKRGIIKAALTRMRNFVDSFDPSTDAISLLEFRQEELPRLNQKFDDIQTQIELTVVDDSGREEEERSRFESDYFRTRSQIQEMVDAKKSLNNSIHNSTLNMSATQARVQLPPIKMPEFSGNIQGWESFFDCFRSMVHDVNTLTPAQKFYYLRSCITGAALDLIKAVPMTDANYEVAIERLKQRYDNKSLVIQSHIRSLLESPYVESPNATELQQLHSHVCSHVAALKALDQPIDKWDAWLITIISIRLDKDTSHGWQLHQRNTQLPRYADLEVFLASRCVAMENSNQYSFNTERRMNSSAANTKAKGSYTSNNVKKLALLAERKDQVCTHCSGQHRLFFCDAFKKLDISARLNVVRDAALCFNCLSPHHVKDHCKSKFSCQTCKGRHNTLLHLERSTGSISPKNENKSVAAKEDLPPTSTEKMAMIAKNSDHVFLATAVVTVSDKFGSLHKCRAVLDSGSQINLVSKRFASSLHLEAKSDMVPISGIGSSKSQSSSSVELHVRSLVNNCAINLTCHILPVIVNELSAIPAPRDGWKIPDKLVPHLADPSFCESRPIDLLIGSAIFFDLLGTSRISLGVGNLCLQDSKLGWIVTGGIDATCLINVQERLNNAWQISPLNESPYYGSSAKANLRRLEEKEVVRHFKETATRSMDGRFVLRLPVKQGDYELGNSLSMAMSRFINVERRLQRDQHLRTEYTKFMDEYLQMGHMKEVIKDLAVPQTLYYLPHHAVLKSSSLTTKVRVVFDASAKTTSGLSLNDILMKGPTVQEDIFSILIRFRKHQYVITSDIEKMFRQISVAEEDWDLQRILWRSDPGEALRTFQLTTVTYGTTPASFMATQCLISLADQVSEQHPKASSIIKRDFYMDDLMTGCDTEEECYQLHREISLVLNSAKLPLRKWCSNSPSVLHRISKVEQEPLFTLDISDDDTVKSLGLGWKPFLDEFLFNIAPSPDVRKLTKRTLLSQLNSVFDPLGFLAPVLVKGKIFLKQLWQLKIDWDTPLQDDLKSRWHRYYTELEELKNLSIPRKCISSLTQHVQVFGFCDASEEAYGACIYIRTRIVDGTYQSRLLCAKTRIAPIKGQTIPRLELNGALLLTELSRKVAHAWASDLHSFQFWTDSTVVLGWLHNRSKRLKTYVANRVAQILEVTTVEQWRHVRSHENPADMPSRGISSAELFKSQLWWNGPEWLSQVSEQWTVSAKPDKEEDLPETKTVRLALIAIDPSKDLLQHFSTWNKLVRATAWLSKFIKFQRGKKTRDNVSQYLTVSDLRLAENILIRRAQNDEFPLELLTIKDKKELPKRSKLKGLCPFLRRDGLLVVGGRLENANISEDQKHPVVLPAKHKITRLLFENYHRMFLHCGPQALLAAVRQRYWPMQGRVIARSITSRCVICIRARPRFEIPIMAPLPKHRVQFSRPFAITGVDFAGPLLIRSGVRRVTAIKTWIAVFVCFSTRAIHLEAVVGLTKDAFLAALRRFMSRRGKCLKIYSDNGTNFVGAQRELSLYLEKNEDFMAREGVEWHFNPPSAPHFGGLWESAVKSTKIHLVRILKDTRLNLEELQTLLCQIEACVNSRPMTPLSSDPGEPGALTPAHFLIGGPLLLPPEAEIQPDSVGPLRRWKFLQGLMQSFWRRWYREYLPQLQNRGRWMTSKRQMAINDIVIIKEDNTAPTKWKLGRVIKTHPGGDGVVRVVTLQTPTGAEVKRPVAKLCRLPTDNEFQNVENQ